MGSRLADLPLPVRHGAHLHRMQSSGGAAAAAPGDGAIEGSGFLARPSSSIGNLLGDQVSSVQHPHLQQSAVDQEAAALSALISQQRGETHLNAAKKRMRAVIGCKESPDKDIKSLKRIRTAQCKASQQQNCDSIAKRVKLKPTIVIVEKPNSHQSPLSKQKSLPDQKSSQSKSNVTEASSLTQDHFAPIKQDFIHVRARRGQATDSHSLAERVRREKISQRMKYLQDLVPSCIKVSGKAMMLDEIINYVQSLQRQVEFLSMKLAAVPPNRLKFNFDDLCSNKAMQPNNVTSVSGSSSAAATPFVSVPRAEYSSNIGQSSCFQNSVRSDETLPDSGRSCNVRSSMQPQTPLDQGMSMTFSGADQFSASLSCDLGVDDPLMSRNAADISSCNLGASSTDVILNQPIHQLCISQSSGQVELEWDEDLQTIVQQMGSFNSQASSLLFPLDNLLTEGYIVQGIAKEEL